MKNENLNVSSQENLSKSNEKLSKRNFFMYPLGTLGRVFCTTFSTDF